MSGLWGGTLFCFQLLGTTQSKYLPWMSHYLQIIFVDTAPACSIRFTPLRQVYNEEVKDLIGAGSVGATSRSSTSPCWGFGTPPRGQQSGVGGGGGGGGGLQLRETPEGDVTVVDLSQHKVSVMNSTFSHMPRDLCIF